MKKIYRIIISIILIFLMVSISAFTVSGYSLLGYKNKSSTVNYYYDNYNSSRFKDFVSKGASSWNSAKVDAKFSYKYASGIVCSETSNSKVSWDGISYYSHNSKNQFTSQSIVINKAMPAWNTDGALKSVVVHEFGHQLGLDDLYNGSKAVMNGYTYGNNSRYGTYKISAPTTDDKNGVNKIY